MTQAPFHFWLCLRDGQVCFYCDVAPIRVADFPDLNGGEKCWWRSCQSCVARDFRSFGWECLSDHWLCADCRSSGVLTFLPNGNWCGLCAHYRGYSSGLRPSGEHLLCAHCCWFFCRCLCWCGVSRWTPTVGLVSPSVCACCRVMSWGLPQIMEGRDPLKTERILKTYIYTFKNLSTVDKTLILPSFNEKDSEIHFSKNKNIYFFFKSRTSYLFSTNFEMKSCQSLLLLSNGFHLAQAGIFAWKSIRGTFHYQWFMFYKNQLLEHSNTISNN